MTSYYASRVHLDAELSQRRALKQELEFSKVKQLELTRYEDEYRQLKAAEEMKAEREYQEYQLRRETQKRQADMEYIHQKLQREQKQKQYQLELGAERRARQLRQDQIQAQRNIDEEQAIRRAETIVATKHIEHEKQIRIKEEAQRETQRVYEEQKEQERLEADLKRIDLQIGSTYDEREHRRRDQLRQLQGLDERSFNLKKLMRASKVKQMALEESLSRLSKVIV